MWEFLLPVIRLFGPIRTHWMSPGGRRRETHAEQEGFGDTFNDVPRGPKSEPALVPSVRRKNWKPVLTAGCLGLQFTSHLLLFYARIDEISR